MLQSKAHLIETTLKYLQKISHQKYFHSTKKKPAPSHLGFALPWKWAGSLKIGWLPLKINDKL